MATVLIIGLAWLCLSLIVAPFIGRFCGGAR